MKILIVEDDEFKRNSVAEVVRKCRPEAEVTLERAVNSGLKAIVEKHPDVILLDMSLTTFDLGPSELGGRPQNFGGLEILRQMDRLELSIPVIVITQHERFATGTQEIHLSALYKELIEEHSQNFKGLIYYNSAKGRWRHELRTMIRRTLDRRDGKDVTKSPRRRR
jgi:CheY-like chemotaxis protein